jgi:hypothetical protein
MAGWFAALSPQGVERAREERFASETGFEQACQQVLGLEKLRAEGAKALLHGYHREGRKGCL